MTIRPRRRGVSASARAPRASGWRLADTVIAVAILSLLLVVVSSLRPSTRELSGPVAVTDGDSLAMGVERIRLKGIDAPELGQVCRLGGAEYACGRDARDALRRFVAGGPVVCKGGERDRHGRWLAICWSGETELNRAMVVHGWAVSYGDYRDEESLARESGVGLWAGEFDKPRDWRVVHGQPAEIVADPLARLWSYLVGLFTRG